VYKGFWSRHEADSLSTTCHWGSRSDALHELRVKTIEGNSAGPHLLITGGVHGDELEPVAAICRLLTRIDPVELRGRVSLCPVVNEGAFLRGQRTAEDGLDLARTCPGTPNGTMTERAAWLLCRWIRMVDYYIDLHSGGAAYRIVPLVGYMLHPDHSVLDAQRRMARAFNLPLIWGTDSRLEGRTLSVARDAAIPAIYAEFQGGGTCDAEGVAAYVDGCLSVMRSLDMIQQQESPSQVKWVVEDSRAGSGQLQNQHRARRSGLFQPLVKLGDVLARGTPLGKVGDVVGEPSDTVLAEEDGMVVCLATPRRVRKGQGLAVLVNPS
jgi:predicted deacylase